MNKLLLLISLICFQIIAFTQNLPASDDCSFAPPICNFAGYTGNTSSSFTSSTWPEMNTAFCGSLDNDSYIKFVADNDTINLVVTVTSSKSNLGIQLMIYEAAGCNSGTVTKIKCYNQITMAAGPTNITGTGLTPGNTYYVIFDGYAGDVCNYEIAVPNNGGGISLPALISPNNQTICLGATATLTATGGNGSYDWSTSPNASELNNTNTNTVIATPTSVGTKKYVVSSSNGNSACPSSDTATVVVIDQPVITAGGSKSICLTGTATVSGVNSNTASFTWSHNGAGSLTNTNTLTPTYTPNAADEGKDITLTISASTCNSSASATYTVHVAHRPYFNIGSTQICPNLSSKLSIQDSSNMSSMTWKKNNVVQSTYYSINNPAAGTYNLHLVNSIGCSNDTTITITTQPKVTINYFNSFCGDTIEMKNNSGIDVGAWSCKNCPGTVEYRHQDSLNTGMKVSKFGTYTLIFKEPTCQDADTLVIQMKPTPYIDLIDYKICQGYSQEIATNINEPSFVDDITWSTGEKTSTITVNQPGTYSCTITISGCGSSTASSTVISKVCDLDVPNTFTPNQDGANDQFALLTQDLDFINAFKCVITNRWGNTVAEFSKPDFIWDGKDKSGNLVENGTYFYYIECVTIEDEKLIKEGFISLFHK